MFVSRHGFVTKVVQGGLVVVVAVVKVVVVVVVVVVVTPVHAWMVVTRVHRPCRMISTVPRILGILDVKGAAILASPIFTMGNSPGEKNYMAVRDR